MTNMPFSTKHKQADEQGSAMVVVLLVIMIITMLTIFTVQESVHSLAATATGRKRVQTVAAAEGGLDVAMSVLQGAGAALPCSIPSGTLSTGPTTASYSISITYYDSVDDPLPCSGGTLWGTPTYAVIKSLGTGDGTTYGNRTMEAQVKLDAVAGNGFDKAIFVNQTLQLSNQTNVYGQPGQGQNANVYTNSDFVCQNKETVYGSVYTQGSATAMNSCTVLVDLWAQGGITASNNASIGGNVKSSGGSISFSNPASVAQVAMAQGSISPYCPASTFHGGCVANTTLPPVPQEAFPIVNFVQSAWQQAGYGEFINDGGNCPQTYADIASMANSTQNTVIQTSCALSWANNTNLSTKANLAIFDSGGFTTQNNFDFSSADGQAHNVYLIVPYSAGGGSSQASPCSFANQGLPMSFSNHTSFDPPLNILLYTPCNLSYSNLNTHDGQVYAGGSGTISNNYTQVFMPMPVPGTGTDPGAPAIAYNLEIMYVREVTS